MLHIVSSASLTELADHLAQVLAEPSADPLAPDWVAVPSAGTTRWLRLELARTLGAGGTGHDGVTANIEMPFPGALLRAVLDAGLRDQQGLGEHEPVFDPWRLDHLVWTVLSAIAEHPADPRLASLTHLPDGATRFGQARRIADLFDRYAVHRPDMVRAWSHGRDVDPQGAPLHETSTWQPHLWRLVRAHMGAPSAPELLPTLLARLRSGDLDLGLPPRLAVFGLSTLPAGRTFLDLAGAIGCHREVHLLLVDPSPAATDRVRPRALAQAHERGPDAGPLSRADDTTAAAVSHPLTAAWTHVRREATVLLAEAEALGGLPAPRPPTVSGAGAVPSRTTLLARLQADIRADAPPAPTHVLDPHDGSVQLHLCHGPTRQLEVARDAILHLLAQDPTLREDDVVVLSPDVARFSPLVEATFGPPADREGTSHHGPPLLRWRVTDRSLRSAHPMLDALAALLELIGGRFEASAVQQLCALTPARRRWGFDDDALEQISRWVDDTDLRWGLDAEHRTRWGLPADHEANSWRAALDQLLTGVAVADDHPTFGPGQVVAVGVEGGAVSTLGSLADLLARLADLAHQVATPRTAEQWATLLAQAADDLFEVDRRDDWQRARLRQVLASITEQAHTSAGPSTVPLGLADIRRLLADQLEGRPPRASFLDGGLTISSLQPLRGVPHRVVCIVGLDDQGGAGPAGLLGDDLIAQQPLVGDRDPRADERQALLEALLAAGDHLIITRNGHDVRTNQPLPAAVALAELRDTIAATLVSDHGAPDALAAIERVHARQAYDDAELLPGHEGARPWSFDPRALAGAHARRGRHATPAPDPTPLAPTPASVVTLHDLQDFLAHPVRSFYRDRLGLVLASRDEAPTDQLPVALSALQSWQLGTELLTARTLGNDESRWLAIEAARGVIPPGVLGHTDLRTIHAEVELLLAAADVHPGARRALERHEVDIDGLPPWPAVRVVGTVGGCRGGEAPGPTELTYRRSGPKLLLRLWLDLLALTVAHPTVPWQALGVARGPSGKPTSKPPVTTVLRVAGESDQERCERAAHALGVVVDLYQRGQREPLPLFADTSHALATGTGASSAWGGYDRGDALDRYNRQAFGACSFPDLLALPTLPHDPPGPTVGRALRYATTLWTAYAASVQEEDA